MVKYMHMLRNGTDITRGKSYEITQETDTAFYFLDDIYDVHAMRRDEEGNWFTLDTAVSLEYKRTQLATLTAEIAELEAQLAEESRLKVGDYARVTNTFSVDSFELEDIVRITDRDSTGYPFYGESPINGRGEWLAEEAITKITPAEARASLIAKIDAHFGGQEAK